MGKLWDRFQDRLSEFVEGPPTPIVAPAVDPPVVEKFRSWRDEPISEYQRRDLLSIVDEPGYEVLMDLHESTLEGFITYLVETPVEDEKKVLALHKLCHAGYLYNRSVMQQVAAYKQIADTENAEAMAIKAAMRTRSGDPLEDFDTLRRVLDPIHVTEPPLPKQRQSKNTESPMETMLQSRE